MAKIYFTRLDEYWTRIQKLDFLAEKGTYQNLQWQEIIPDNKHNWLTEGLYDSFDGFVPMGTKDGKASKSEVEGVVFKVYSRGAETTRDTWAYNFNQNNLAENMQISIEFYNDQVSKLSRQPKETKIDDFANYDDKKISWSSSLKRHFENLIFANFNEENIRYSLYRPFSKQYLYFDKIFTHRRGQFPSIFPTPETEAENKVICCSAVGNNKSFHNLMTNVIPDLHFTGDSQCFPFYTYTEDGSHRQENITDWALENYQTHYQDNTITKWGIFYYVYGLLHHQGYRDKYQKNLKRELPRLPYAPDFWKFSQAGQQLAELHLNYEQQEPYELQDETKGNLDWRVEKMRLSKDKTTLVYNNTLTLKGIPPKVFDYKLGNRSALQWIIEQYKIKTDKRSGITNDPNRPDEPRYIFELVGKVITVSLKTVEIVEQLNKETFEE